MTTVFDLEAKKKRKFQNFDINLKKVYNLSNWGKILIEVLMFRSEFNTAKFFSLQEFIFALSNCGKPQKLHILKKRLQSK